MSVNPATARQAGAELARWLAQRAATLAKGNAATLATPAEDAAQHLRALLATLASDPREVDRFFPALARELQARGLRLPAIDAEHLPAEAGPLLHMLAAALDASGDGPAGEFDAQALADSLDEQLGALLGEAPSAARERLLAERAQRRTAGRVAASMRRHGLTPLADSASVPEPLDGHEPLIALWRDDPLAFGARLLELSRERLTEFHWECLGMGQPDAGSEVARVYRERFGEALAPGL